MLSLSRAYSRSEKDLVALYSIHDVGWVHRDMNNGHVYEYGDRGLVVDSEHAGKIGTEANHEVKAVSSFSL